MFVFKRSIVVLGLLVALSVEAASQSFLTTGDIGIVTTAGFYRLRASVTQGQPVNVLAPSAFNSSFSTLSAPRLDWEPWTDNFLVCTGTNLYRVAIASNTSSTITDLTPNVGGTAAFTELDINAGSGELSLYDENTDNVYVFAPPFAVNMTPSSVFASGTRRGMCLDTRDYPPSVVVSTSSTTVRLPLDGSSSIAVLNEGAGSVDNDIQSGVTFLTDKNADEVHRSTSNPALAINLNINGLCSPVALGPTAVAYFPMDSYTYVLAEDGVSATCLSAATGGNHVISLPPAINPSFPPLIVTDPSGSGISGTNGDLALVLSQLAFPSPYGFGCAAPSTGNPAILDCNGLPYPGNSSFALTITGAPASKAMYMLFGTTPQAQVQPSGCTLYVVASVAPFYVGTTDGSGNLTVSAPIPGSAPVGSQSYQQIAYTDSAYTILSNGLLLHY